MGHGFSERRLARITDVIEAAVTRGEISGAVALTHRRGHEAYFGAVGLRDREKSAPMTRDTLFRLASMTKPIVSAAMMTLVEENKIRLFDAVDKWLPELAHRSVMRDPNGSLDDVTPSPRAITLHDVMTYRMGIGWGPSVLRGKLFGLMASPLAEPQSIKNEQLAPDAWMARLGSMPLPYAPGSRWLYHTAGDVLGVLVARIAGKSLENVLHERIFEPLGMTDTSFFVPEPKKARLSVVYAKDKATAALTVVDGAANSRWGAPPIFESGAGGLVGTIDDFQRFGRMLLNHGELGGVRILSRKSVEAMTTDYLSPEEHAVPFGNFDRYDQDGSPIWKHRGFGYGVSVRTNRIGLGPSVGSFTWPGAFGTTWLADPREEMMTTLLVQHLPPNPFYSVLGEDVLTANYQAISD